MRSKMFERDVRILTHVRKYRNLIFEHPVTPMSARERFRTCELDWRPIAVRSDAGGEQVRKGALVEWQQCLASALIDESAGTTAV